MGVGVLVRTLRLGMVAESYFTWAARVVPEHRALFLAERGLARARRGQREGAIGDAVDAVNLRGGDPRYLLYLAWVYEDLLSPIDAARTYQRALDLAGDTFSQSMRRSIRLKIEEHSRASRGSSGVH